MRLGPLTSMALGRSPYDDVVQGTGQNNPRAPPQEYDGRGRPVNPNTRRINRDVIRSHNEVMQVIGVAEPDNGAAEAAEAAARRKHVEFENRIGSRLFLASGILDTAVVWGINGMRQRILLYKQFSTAPFHDLSRILRSQQSISSYLFSGLPSFVLSTVLQEAPISEIAAAVAIPKLERVDENLVLKFRVLSTPRAFRIASRYAATYIRLHLDIFVFLQRVGLVSSTAMLPPWSFFLPGSSSSPIFIPPLPNSFTIQSLTSWLSQCAFGILPFASYYTFSFVYNAMSSMSCALALSLLPSPRNPERRQRVLKTTNEPSAPPNAAPSSGQDEAPRNGRDITRDQPDVRALEGQPQNEALPVGGTRRQSTVSVRGDDFASDDEENDMVSATLISFDVEATESTDSTPGVWSAELRPNLSDARPEQGLRYRDTTLVRLVPILAADVIGVAMVRLLMAQEESLVWTRIARSFLANRGLPTDSLCVPTLVPFFGMNWRRWVNILGLEALFLTLQGGIWAAVVSLARKYFYTDAEWNKLMGIVPSSEDP
ncbi:hypothetical protein OQA88_6400 [Cercophora sp. LCS_1]